ncbi:MAG: M23 family metallopeptidase [Alcaligenaceae bacterium]|nr:M23 family metallopeptidase [Alcaligenaceae bacterium]
MAKKFVSPRRARQKTQRVWSFSITVLCVCIALVSGALLERRYGYQQQSGLDGTASDVTSVHQNPIQQNLIEHGLGQFAQELAEVKITLENITQITDRLSSNSALNLGIAGDTFPHSNLSEDDRPMEEFIDEGGYSGEKIGRELDLLKQRLYQQENRLRTFDVLMQSRQIDMDRVPTGIPVSMLQARMSSPFGWRAHPISGTSRLHTGLDFAAPKGTPIYAASNGVVSSSAYVSGYGNLVEIDHGSGVTTVYAHNNENLVEAGDIVGRRQIIARIGNTGNSTGPHLHFEVRLDGIPIDPMLVLGKDLSEVEVPSGGSLLETLKLLSQD